MAQTDWFEFLINPKLDISKIDDSSKHLERKLKEVSTNIANELTNALGALPQGLKASSLTEISKYIEDIGGSVKRNGGIITASFKDASGNVISLKQDISETYDILEKVWAGNKANEKIIERLRTSSETTADPKLEQQIISLVQERYNLENKITDAKASGNKIAETYYTQLRNIAVTEEQQLESQYKGSQIRINSTKQQLSLEQQLRQQKAQSTAEENKAVEAVKQYAKQYQTIKQLESKGQQGTQAYTDAKNALQQLTVALTQYGVQVVTSSDGTTKLVVQQNSMADSSDKVKKALDNANGSLLKTDTTQNSLTKTIQDSVENFLKYQVAMEAINKITSEFTQAIGDMNGAMAQVRMVTMGSYEDTVALADSYTQLAKQLGTTTTEVAKGADTWLRQGYSAQDAMEMLKQSTTLAVVGQLDASEATNDLTA